MDQSIVTSRGSGRMMEDISRPTENDPVAGSILDGSNRRIAGARMPLPLERIESKVEEQVLLALPLIILVGVFMMGL